METSDQALQIRSTRINLNLLFQQNDINVLDVQSVGPIRANGLGVEVGHQMMEEKDINTCLFTEAAAYGSDENESLELKAQKALECPCIAHLRNGPCGSQFSEAFLCFLKSTAEEKGSDCVSPFVALQNCIKSNPDAFSEDTLEEEDDVKKEEEPPQEYKIIPPIWSKESQSQKAKL